MFDQTAQSFYVSPLFLNCALTVLPFNVSPLNYIEIMSMQVQQLREQQIGLLHRINLFSQEAEQIQAENIQLRETITAQELRPKRKYRTRRTWLQKKYRCNAKGCKGKYSSKIALNCHKRKKHLKKVSQ